MSQPNFLLFQKFYWINNFVGTTAIFFWLEIDQIFFCPPKKFSPYLSSWRNSNRTIHKMKNPPHVGIKLLLFLFQIDFNTEKTCLVGTKKLFVGIQPKNLYWYRQNLFGTTNFSMGDGNHFCCPRQTIILIVNDALDIFEIKPWTDSNSN